MAIGEFVTKGEFETFKKNLVNRTLSGESLPPPIYLHGNGYIANPMIEIGSSAVLAAGTTITFDHAFAAAPIMACSAGDSMTYASCSSITTTSFKGRTVDEIGVARDGVITWIAIGKRV